MSVDEYKVILTVFRFGLPLNQQLDCNARNYYLELQPIK